MRMRAGGGLGLAVLLFLGSIPAMAQDQPTTPAATRADHPKARSTFTPEREAAALAFVEQNHPELAALLERLKPMNRNEYETAILDLFRVSENLAALRDRDSKRYALMLDAWKARSRVDLLVAQYATQPTPALESALRNALDAQINVELRQHRYEREIAAARLKRAEEAIAKLTTKRDETVASRFEALRKKGLRSRAFGARKKPAPTPPRSARPRPMGEATP